MKRKKPIVIFIYGPIAVGKLTVAEFLVKKLNFKLVHNHILNDMLMNVFDRQSDEYGFLSEKLRFFFFGEVVKLNHDFIITQTYAHNYTNEVTGLSDPEYIKKQKIRLEKLGARVCCVHLKAPEKELLKRLKGESRKHFKKLKTIATMKQLHKKYDFETSPSIKGQLVIETTNMKPVQVANEIIEYFNL